MFCSLPLMLPICRPPAPPFLRQPFRLTRLPAAPPARPERQTCADPLLTSHVGRYPQAACTALPDRPPTAPTAHRHMTTLIDASLSLSAQSAPEPTNLSMASRPALAGSPDWRRRAGVDATTEQSAGNQPASRRHQGPRQHRCAQRGWDGHAQTGLAAERWEAKHTRWLRRQHVQARPALSADAAWWPKVGLRNEVGPMPMPTGTRCRRAHDG